jgi:hypothetical protein
VLKLISVVAAFVERDEFVARLGGEVSRKLGLDLMRKMAYNFFSTKFMGASGQMDRAKLAGVMEAVSR